MGIFTHKVGTTLQTVYCHGLAIVLRRRRRQQQQKANNNNNNKKRRTLTTTTPLQFSFTHPYTAKQTDHHSSSSLFFVFVFLFSALS